MKVGMIIESRGGGERAIDGHSGETQWWKQIGETQWKHCTVVVGWTSTQLTSSLSCWRGLS